MLTSITVCCRLGRVMMSPPRNHYLLKLSLDQTHSVSIDSQQRHEREVHKRESSHRRLPKDRREGAETRRSGWPWKFPTTGHSRQHAKAAVVVHARWQPTHLCARASHRPRARSNDL